MGRVLEVVQAIGADIKLLKSATDSISIDIHSVTTSSPGTNASVINIGTSKTAILDFVIPRGSDGSNGKTILNGTTSPSNGIGTNGDFYINTTTSEIYGPKTSGSWGTATSLKGSAPILSTRSISSATAITTTDDIIIANGEGSYNITLPTAVGSNKQYTIKSLASGTVTVNTLSSQTIDSESTYSLGNKNCVTVISTGSQWIITSAY
jgi:hypothetical protein